MSSSASRSPTATSPARSRRISTSTVSSTLDLTHDELAKEHIRHLVGGKSELAHDELLYRFEFPERPGALMRFLDSMAPNWNISLFHYRNQGGDFGRILVGLQVPKKEMKAFRALARRTRLSPLG